MGEAHETINVPAPIAAIIALPVCAAGIGCVTPIAGSCRIHRTTGACRTPCATGIWRTDRTTGSCDSGGPSRDTGTDSGNFPAVPGAQSIAEC